MPSPDPPTPIVIDVRLENSPVVHMGVGEHELPPAPTAEWDDDQEAWVDEVTYLVIELQPVEGVAGYAIWQDGEFVASATSNSLTEATVDLASLPDPSGRVLELRYYREGVAEMDFHDGPDVPGLSPPVEVRVPR